MAQRAIDLLACGIKNRTAGSVAGSSRWRYAACTTYFFIRVVADLADLPAVVKVSLSLMLVVILSYSIAVMLIPIDKRKMLT